MRTDVLLVISFIISLVLELIKVYGPALSKAAGKEVGKKTIHWFTEKGLRQLSGSESEAKQLQPIEQQPIRVIQNVTINIYLGRQN